MKVGAVSFATLFAALSARQFLNRANADDKLPQLNEDDPMAKALGYRKDATKVDAAKFPKRAGAEGKTQFCKNCMFYNSPSGKSGKCQIFVGKEVMAMGWCNSWSKKP